ncbi:MAG: hypothetical protein Q8Q37_02745 [bacterium]|nr:hypothetical protein [bacterium]
MDKDIVKRRQQQVLYDIKWRKLSKRTWIFRHLPFVDFVLAAGSLATGNVHESSDFDVLISVKQGRIFTARAVAVVVLGLLGWRRRKLSHKESAADKICLNHFVTNQSWRLSPPHNYYWQKLYKNLVPIFGDANMIDDFWAANHDWLGESVILEDDLRYDGRSGAIDKRFLETILAGWLGNKIEKYFKTIQTRKIERSLKTDRPGYEPRIKYGDAELEFHPDTRRIAEYQRQEGW